MTDFRDSLGPAAVLLRVETNEINVTDRCNSDDGDPSGVPCEFCGMHVEEAHYEDDLRRDGVVLPQYTAPAIRLLVRDDGYSWWMPCCPDCLWDAQVLQREHAQAEALQHLQAARDTLIRCGSVVPSDSLELQKAGLAVDTARKAVGNIGLAPTIDEQLEAS